MASLTVEFGNALRNPLADIVDVHVWDTVTNVEKGRIMDHRAFGTSVKFEKGLVERRHYRVDVRPHHYRPVQCFVQVRKHTTATVYCPINPEAVDHVNFASYQNVGSDFERVMSKSSVEGHAERKKRALYRNLDVVSKAGLLNLFAKMAATTLPTNKTAWSYIKDLYRIRGDRVFANVRKSFWDGVKIAVSVDQFEEVSGQLHTPPPGFKHAGSFKSNNQYGNLQLTFFCSTQGRLRFKVDADIDAAKGILHAFHVAGNLLTGSSTHPYDIHQILSFHQGIIPQYALQIATKPVP